MPRFATPPHIEYECPRCHHFNPADGETWLQCRVCAHLWNIKPSRYRWLWNEFGVPVLSGVAWLLIAALVVAVVALLFLPGHP